MTRMGTALDERGYSKHGGTHVSVERVSAKPKNETAPRLRGRSRYCIAKLVQLFRSPLSVPIAPFSFRRNVMPRDRKAKPNAAYVLGSGTM